LPEIGESTDPEVSTGKGSILRPRSIGGNGSGGPRPVSPGRTGKDGTMFRGSGGTDATRRRSSGGISAVSASVRAIVPIKMHPAAAGVRNLLFIAGRGNMGIVPRCADRMIVIRPVLLLTDRVRIVGTEGMTADDRPWTGEIAMAAGVTIRRTLRMTPDPVELIGMGPGGSGNPDV